MNKCIICLFILIFCGCNTPTKFDVFDAVKPADSFARSFIEKIINGELENCFADISSEVINDSMKNFITNASYNLKGSTFKKYSIVEQKYTTGYFSSSGKYTEYRLSYEYEFEQGNLLFLTLIREKEGVFSVTGFDGLVLSAPLEELTKFGFTNKSFTHYLFLLFAALIPLFVLTTLIIMLRHKMSNKRKVIWTLIIIFICLPRFIINWGSGNIDFNILNFSMFGGSYSKLNLYSDWLISFNIPIGAILFWIKRKDLEKKDLQTDVESSIINNNV